MRFCHAGELVMNHTLSQQELLAKIFNFSLIIFGLFDLHALFETGPIHVFVGLVFLL